MLSRTERTLRGTAWRLFLTCWLVYALHFATNTVREIYPALSLGDHLSLDVSEYVGLHPDIFTVPGRGAYINNNPGASLLGAIPYAVTRPFIARAVEAIQQQRLLSGAPAPEYDNIYPLAREFYREAYARGLDVKFALGAGVMQALLMAPLSALGAVTMFHILYGLTRRQRAALLLALLYAFATPVFYRTAQLNQNVLIANFALFAWALLWRPWDDPTAPRRPRYLLAGLLCGWTLVLDYSGAVAVAALSLYAWAKQRALPAALRRPADLIEYGAGVLASVSVLFITQWIAFGHPLLAAQHYMPPTQYSVIGYNGMTWPQPDLLWQTAFGLSFGLFTSAPLLLPALYVPGWWNTRMRLLPRRETLLALGFTVALFLFAAANQFGRLQFNSGVRYVVPAVPFLFLLAAGPLLRLPRVVGLAVAVLGTYWSWCLAMYRDVEQGLGVLESLIHITTEGVRLPWLVTLQRLGFIGDARLYSAVLLGLAAVGLALLWGVRLRPRPALARPSAEQSR
jgi:hypothetical protein